MFGKIVKYNGITYRIDNAGSLGLTIFKPRSKTVYDYPCKGENYTYKDNFNLIYQGGHFKSLNHIYATIKQVSDLQELNK